MINFVRLDPEELAPAPRLPKERGQPEPVRTRIGNGRAKGMPRLNESGKGPGSTS
jgi:hypothetical protein